MKIHKQQTAKQQRHKSRKCALNQSNANSVKAIRLAQTHASTLILKTLFRCAPWFAQFCFSLSEISTCKRLCVDLHFLERHHPTTNPFQIFSVSLLLSNEFHFHYYSNQVRFGIDSLTSHLTAHIQMNIFKSMWISISPKLYANELKTIKKHFFFVFTWFDYFRLARNGAFILCLHMHLIFIVNKTKLFKAKVEKMSLLLPTIRAINWNGKFSIFECHFWKSHWLLGLHEMCIFNFHTTVYVAFIHSGEVFSFVFSCWDFWDTCDIRSEFMCNMWSKKETFFSLFFLYFIGQIKSNRYWFLNFRFLIK